MSNVQSILSFLCTLHGTQSVCRPFDVPAAALSADGRYRQIPSDATEHSWSLTSANTIRTGMESSPLRVGSSRRPSCWEARQSHAHRYSLPIRSVPRLTMSYYFYVLFLLGCAGLESETLRNLFGCSSTSVARASSGTGCGSTAATYMSRCACKILK